MLLEHNFEGDLINVFLLLYYLMLRQSSMAAAVTLSSQLQFSCIYLQVIVKVSLFDPAAFRLQLVVSNFDVPPFIQAGQYHVNLYGCYPSYF